MPDSSSSESHHHKFHQAALTKLRGKLTNYGNEISTAHDLALSGLCELASMILFRGLEKRVNFALPCGMGKTTGVRAILETIHELDLPFRVVVASSKVEELCALKRTLVTEDGIPLEKLGLQHSYLHSPERVAAGHLGFASEASHNHDAQFLLVTHANVQSGEAKSWMKRCDLVLFDESLVVGEAHCLPLYRDSTGAPSVFSELSVLEAFAKGQEPGLGPAAEAARSLYDQLQVTARNLSDSPVGIVQAGRFDAARIGPAREALAQNSGFPLVRQLFEWAEQAAELRVLSSSVDRTTLITYSVSVPDHLRRVVVLDASGPIRELVHHDKRMERAENVVPSLKPFRLIPGGLASIKYHSNVQVHFVCVGGGRSTLTSELMSDTSPWVLEKLARLIASKPSESFLVFTHKARERGMADFSQRILRTLADAGIDHDEMLPSGIRGVGVPRVAITTWGKETGTNEFSDYQNVVLLGVMRKPEEAVAGVYLGQVDDLRCPRMKTVTRRLVDSECWHSIYQAINRCRMRRVRVEGGVAQAHACNVYIWHLDTHLESRLSPVLSDCPPWLPWREPGEGVKAIDVAMRIRSELNRLAAAGITKISCRALRKLIPPAGDQTFRRGREMAVRESGWVMDKATLNRLMFPAAA